MKDILIFIFESLTTGAVMMATYTLLLNGRVSFSRCRAWLILSMVLMAAVPFVDIPVWPARIIEAAPVAVPQAGITDATVASTPAFDAAQLLVVLYMVGALTILGAIVRQWLQIRNLRRDAEIAESEGVTVVSTRRRIASFSFLRSVYLWRETPQEDLPQIMAHERSHIAHSHSLERIAVEIAKAALWWNPFAWIASRRIVEVEEFEADADVLGRGWERDEYMKTIFRQMTGYSPEIASSLGDSLTKKRFKMMTTKRAGRYARLRMAATLPILGALLCALTFTSQATEFRAAEPPQPQPQEEMTTLTLSGIEGKIVSINGKDAAAVEKKPLFIVDGEERDRMDDIPSSSVVSVQIHKDAATIAKYGDKAKNGVVFIKTKAAADKAAPKEVSASLPLSNTLPVFRGGDVNTFLKWVMSQIKYPDTDGSSGTVVAQFTITKEGELTDIKILRSPHESFSKEVRRVLELSPKWAPGKQDGENADMQLTLPVDFKAPAQLSGLAPTPWTKEPDTSFHERLQELKSTLDGLADVDLSTLEGYRFLAMKN